MTVDRATLIAAFPEFADETLFSNEQVSFWLGASNATLSLDLFGAQLPLAVCLYTAHNLALSVQGAASGKGGGASFGAPAGITTSKSVGPVSKGVDVTLTAFEGAGPWNATSYGQRYYQLIRAFAAGAFYRTKSAPQAIPYNARPLA